MRRKNLNVDAPVLIKDAAKLLPNPSRRLFLRGGASLGALTLLTGCDIVDGPTSERALRVISEFNDWVQARLFNPNRLAQTYAESAIRARSVSTATTTNPKRRMSTKTPTGSSSMA